MKNYLIAATLLAALVCGFIYFLVSEDSDKTPRKKPAPRTTQTVQTAPTVKTVETVPTEQTVQTSNIELSPESAGKAMESASVRNAVGILQNAIATNSEPRRAAMVDALKRMPKEIVIGTLRDEAARSDARLSAEIRKVIHEIQ